MADYTGLVAIVTGGASGLGAAITQHLRASGATVAVIDRSAGHDPTPVLLADLTESDAVTRAVDSVVQAHGRIDVLVNNAGIGAQGDVAANDDAEWHRVWDVNVLGTVRVIRAALPHLRSSESAAVVNVASVVAHVGLPQRALYSATKGAIVSLTRALAVDHLDDGIRFNSVSPGTADTPWVQNLLASSPDPDAALTALKARQPHGRLVSPAEIASAVAYLGHPESASTNGIDLVVDGGLSTMRKPAT